MSPPAVPEGASIPEVHAPALVVTAPADVPAHVIAADEAKATRQADEQKITTQGQRRINLIWEGTQAMIAIAITFAQIYVSVKNIDSETISNSFFLIVGFYFGRTNHTKIGGFGNPPGER